MNVYIDFKAQQVRMCGGTSRGATNLIMHLAIRDEMGDKRQGEISAPSVLLLLTAPRKHKTHALAPSCFLKAKGERPPGTHARSVAGNRLHRTGFRVTTATWIKAHGFATREHSAEGTSVRLTSSDIVALWKHGDVSLNIARLRFNYENGVSFETATFLRALEATFALLWQCSNFSDFVKLAAAKYLARGLWATFKNSV